MMWFAALLGLLVVGGMIVAVLGTRDSNPWPGLFLLLFGVTVMVTALISLLVLSNQAVVA